jgi:hypothetical protein
MAVETPQANRPREDASFAETALALGGKSADEARRTGAVDTADDQVEALFAPRYQTVNSPAHRAVWDRRVPVDLFVSAPPVTPPDVERVMDDSIAVVRRHVEAGTLHNDEGKIADAVLKDLGAAGYWGLLVDKEHGGSGAPFSSLPVSRMAVIVDSGTFCLRAWPVCAPHTYMQSNSRATVIPASTRTRWSSLPSKRSNKVKASAVPPAKPAITLF